MNFVDFKFIRLQTPSSAKLALSLCSLVVLSQGCGLKSSGLSSRNNASAQVTETTASLDENSLKIQLTEADSERLVKNFSKVSIQPVPPLPQVTSSKLFQSSGEDLSLQCVNSTAGGVSKLCTLTVKIKPTSKDNFLQSDLNTNEHMFHLRNIIDAKRLYSSLDVKEWDLQGSTYKRFSSSDNKMILECILDDVRSRCSIFMSNGQSDDFND